MSGPQRLRGSCNLGFTRQPSTFLTIGERKILEQPKPSLSPRSEPGCFGEGLNERILDTRRVMAELRTKFSNRSDGDSTPNHDR